MDDYLDQIGNCTTVPSPRGIYSGECTRRVGQCQLERCDSTREDTCKGQLTSDKRESDGVRGVFPPNYQYTNDKVHSNKVWMHENYRGMAVEGEVMGRIGTYRATTH